VNPGCCTPSAPRAGDYPLGDYAAKSLGFKRMAIVAEDFTYGHRAAGGFHSPSRRPVARSCKNSAPLNAPDYAPYLAQDQARRGRHLYGLAGEQSAALLKQLEDYGLKGGSPCSQHHEHRQACSS